MSKRNRTPVNYKEMAEASLRVDDGSGAGAHHHHHAAAQPHQLPPQPAPKKVKKAAPVAVAPLAMRTPEARRKEPPAQASSHHQQHQHQQQHHHHAPAVVAPAPVADVVVPSPPFFPPYRYPDDLLPQRPPVVPREKTVPPRQDETNAKIREIDERVEALKIEEAVLETEMDSVSKIFKAKRAKARRYQLNLERSQKQYLALGPEAFEADGQTLKKHAAKSPAGSGTDCVFERKRECVC